MNRNDNEHLHDDDAWAERLDAIIRESPREREPGRVLEERTVASLRAHGLLTSKPSRRVAISRMAGAIAASIALFASGVVVGQWLGTRNTATAFMSARNDALLNALQVQHAGSAYVDALQALAPSSDSMNAQASAQGREAALAVFHAAASEMVRLAPDDPIAAEILRGLQRERQQSQDREENNDRKIIWY